MSQGVEEGVEEGVCFNYDNKIKLAKLSQSQGLK